MLAGNDGVGCMVRACVCVGGCVRLGCVLCMHVRVWLRMMVKNRESASVRVRTHACVRVRVRASDCACVCVCSCMCVPRERPGCV